MSLSVCVQGLVADGRIRQGTAAEAEKLYNRFYHSLKHTMGMSAAAQEASDRAIKAIEGGLLRKKRLALLQVQAQTRILSDARTKYAGGEFAEGPISGKALLAHLVRDYKGNGINNVELHARVLLDEARRMNYDLLNRYRRNVLGEARHKAEELDLARALHGEQIDDVNVRELAETARRVNDMQRSRFNAAGGDVPALEDFGVRHQWDAYRVGAMTPDQFVAAFAPEVDRARMIDWDTGLPFDDAGLDGLLRDVYDSIVSEGANTRTPGGAAQGRAFANRYAEHRVLHFKDAESWLRMNEKFGTGTVFDAVNGQMERWARATASMEILGPNPAATVKWMTDLVDIEAKTKGGIDDRAAAVVRSYEIEKVWAEISGANQRVVRPNLALFMAANRNWQVATKLGSAVITALSDQGTRRVARSFAGMPEFQLAGQYLRQIMPFLGNGDRSFARRHMIISDEFAGRMAGIGRMHLDDAFGGRLKPRKFDLRGAMETGYEVTRRLADAQMRLSGLSGATVASREVAAMEFVSNMSHWAAKGWDDIDPDWRLLLQQGGIDAAKWDIIRASPRTEFRGMEWLLPENIPDRALSEAVRRLQFDHIDRGVPSADLLITALTKANPAGTISGEVTRATIQFKMFPLTVMAQHGRFLMARPGWKGKAGYAAAFLGATTLMGMASLQLYELINGRDPLPMDKPDTVARAMQKGGGLGMFGDALMMSRNEFGQSVGDLTVGPGYSTVQNVASAGWAVGETGVAALTEDPDDDTAAAKARGGAMRNLLRRETPVLNNWYTRLAYERLFVELMADWASGDSLEASYAASERYAEQKGNAYWAPPGQRFDNLRTPDWANATGAETP